MVGLSKRMLVALSLLAAWPDVAAAGGGEFPADGTRGLGRGGTGFTRADDPTVMLRNPALLADLWDDQAMLSSHLLLQDSCFNPSGAYGVQLFPSTSTVSGGMPGQTGPSVSVLDLGDGPTIIQEQTGTVTDVNGKPLPTPFENERFAEVCFEGPNTFLPSVAVAVKLSDEVGIGLGYFTPEVQGAPQFGNPDGTVNTANGLRPAETRYFLANRNLSFLSFMGSIGWRPASWLRVGAGFQWTMLAFNTTSFARVDDFRDPSGDLRTDAFGRDLFIPGVVVSAHVVPTDWLDIAVGYKWSDNIHSKGKLDLTLSPWGLQDPFSFNVDGQQFDVDKTPSPLTTHNQPGTIDAPPVWVPQLSFGVRISDRLKPRPTDWEAARKSAGRTVEDHMSGERWDLEANAIVYFNQARDYTDFDTTTGELALGTIEKDGRRSSGTVAIGDCPAGLPEQGQECATALRSRREHGGKQQYSFRIGGDYNVLPGLLALRLGGSYETRGINPDFFDPTNYDMTKIGLHAGFTVRLMEKTDISFAYALFMIEDMSIRIPEKSDEEGAFRLPDRWRERQGYGYTYVPDSTGALIQSGSFDGVARFEVPRTRRLNRGPHFANAGDAFYNLSVLSATITQHF